MDFSKEMTAKKNLKYRVCEKKLARCFGLCYSLSVKGLRNKEYANGRQNYDRAT